VGEGATHINDGNRVSGNVDLGADVSPAFPSPLREYLMQKLQAAIDADKKACAISRDSYDIEITGPPCDKGEGEAITRESKWSSFVQSTPSANAPLHQLPEASSLLYGAHLEQTLGVEVSPPPSQPQLLSQPLSQLLPCNPSCKSSTNMNTSARLEPCDKAAHVPGTTHNSIEAEVDEQAVLTQV
jgi:hypothetical protein